VAAAEATTAVGTAVAAVEASADVRTAAAAVEAAGVDVEAASFVASCVANSPDAKSEAPSFGWTYLFSMKGSPEWNVASRTLLTQFRGSSSAAAQSFLQTGHVNFLLWSRNFLMQ
jgi:hypothetical protein